MVRVKAYRTTIVTATPAAYLRQRIADTMGPLTDGIIVDGKTVFKWTFWDKIKAPNLKDIAPLDPAATYIQDTSDWPSKLATPTFHTLVGGSFGPRSQRQLWFFS